MGPHQNISNFAACQTRYIPSNTRSSRSHKFSRKYCEIFLEYLIHITYDNYIGVLKNLANSLEKTCAGVSVLKDAVLWPSFLLKMTSLQAFWELAFPKYLLEELFLLILCFFNQIETIFKKGLWHSCFL